MDLETIQQNIMDFIDYEGLALSRKGWRDLLEGIIDDTKMRLELAAEVEDDEEDEEDELDFTV